MQKILLIVIYCLLFSFNRTVAQSNAISITGPICVLAGGTNGVNYSLSGPDDNDDNITWQISGGIIVGKKLATASGSISALGRDIRVIWIQSSKSGTVKVISKNLGSFTLQVNVITILNKIDSSANNVSKNSSLKINGDGPDNMCSTSFSYWWEFSDSLAGPFTQIDGSNSRNLIRDSLKISGFYRRVLSVNGDNIYSNVIYVRVIESKTSFHKKEMPDTWAILKMKLPVIRHKSLHISYHA